VLRDNLERVRQRVQQACQRCGRQPSSVTLIGVTKTVPPEIIQEAVALGLTELGENRVQEARMKQLALGSRLTAEGKSVQWHLIGHLQSNKIKHAIELFDVVHSVDSVTLIQGLEQQAEQQARNIQSFIQVNVSGETTKSGCRPEDTEALIRVLLRCSYIKLKGLMTIAPFVAHADDARSVFQQLRRLRDQLAHTFSLEPSALSLSMGMSHDFEIAIEEGADWIRVGTAIFGGRG